MMLRTQPREQTFKVLKRAIPKKSYDMEVNKLVSAFPLPSL